jgi:hypothetical protein
MRRNPVFLKSLWVRVGPQRKPRESVALNPVEQLALRFLLGFGPSTRESVYTEVNSIRPADASGVDEALGRLESLNLVESRLSIEDDKSETLFFPSNKGTRLKGHIPPEPQTVTEFYI